jgi:hypothetical protein
VLVYYREFGVVGAVSFGAMVWAVMLMAVILPQMTFNKHAGTIFFRENAIRVALLLHSSQSISLE